jgi:DNA helicase-2/ATP-dependent DNA helicase PcrA
MIFDPYELNYSKVHTYQDCPLLFKYIYVDGRRAPLTPLSSLGISIHKALEAFHADEYRTGEEMVSCFDDVWLGAGYKDAQEQMEHYLRGKRMLLAYARAEEERKSLITCVEKMFDFPYKQWRIKGTVDRIDRHPSGEYEVIDYKSGPEIRTGEELKKSLQLGVYAMGAKMAFGLTPSMISWVFLYHEKRLTAPYDPAFDEVVLEQFVKVGEGIVAGKFEPRREFCSICPLGHACSARPQE